MYLPQTSNNATSNILGNLFMACSSNFVEFSMVAPESPLLCVVSLMLFFFLYIYSYIYIQAAELFGALYRPDPLQYGKGPFPTVLSVYGGPGIQVRCCMRWSCCAIVYFLGMHNKKAFDGFTYPHQYDALTYIPYQPPSWLAVAGV